MIVTRDQLVALHQKAVLHLEIKLKKIPACAFPSGRKPTLAEIYLRSETMCNTMMPFNIELDYIFKNYNEFARANFQARKRDQYHFVSAAIFYWSMDPAHSFSINYDQTRYNVLLAHLVLEDPKARDQLAPALVNFLKGFIYAWLEQAMRVDYMEGEARDNWLKMWKQGEYDLIIWNRRQLKRIYTAIKALKAKVEEPPFNVDQYWDKAREQPVEEFRKHGANWAMQYIVYKTQLSKDAAAKAQAQEVEYALEEGTFVDDFSTLAMDMGDGAPAYLSEELFNQDLVKSLLKDVDEGVTPERPQGVNVLPPEGLGQCWMDPEQAMALLEGRVSGHEDITEQLSRMSFLQ
ncbi:hypothetical protein PTMSG1_05840 [Pyrenophora teres f. maculata]|nr:hypothetical protein PTMSG1_05840 [Pyrenophora teres f. maculata]